MENTTVNLEMEKELYVAAMKGNVQFLEKTQSNEYLLRKTNQKNNILHIAIRRQRLELIEAILKRFAKKRELICEKNSSENTPLHIAAAVGNTDAVRVVYNYLETNVRNEKPWRMKNLKGNTAVHEALVHGNIDIAMFLLENDPYLACIVNGAKESPLHLAIKHYADYPEGESLKTKILNPIINKGRASTTIVPREAISSIIEFLVREASYVTCWPDVEGLTPLHRAASLSTPYNLQIIRFIIEQWPQSTEVCDNSGKSILHLLINRIPSNQDGRNLLAIEEIHDLRNWQDDQGNTPLHIAASNMDIVMVRVLLEFGTNLEIKNLEGLSATSIIKQQNMIEILQKRQMTTEESQAANIADITFLKERLSIIGMDLLLSQDSNGRNILHKLMQVKDESDIQIGYVEFIRQVLNCYPTLVGQTDHNGDTPIHILVGNKEFFQTHSQDLRDRLLHICNKPIIEMEEDAMITGASYSSPWVMQNAKGNTPLHEAIIAGNFDLVRTLIDYDKRPLTLHNKRRETLLHLKNNGMGREDMIKYMASTYPGALYWRDLDGLTPLLRAVQEGYMFQAVALCKIHLTHQLLEYDENGNSALHLAIQYSRYPFIHYVFEVLEESYYIDYILGRPNKDGDTPMELIGELPTIPTYLEERILRHPALRGIRSAWGIPKSQLQNYMSSVNVIAALLTTITFTAAFTVPGGLDQEKGTPLLMGRKAFQVFLISDVIAMCLSMMVLFCLLWIVATNKRDSVMIQDFAVSLLLASFVATLLTFMAGVHATIFPVKPRIATATLVLCSMLMLLVHRFILTKLLLPFKNAIVNLFRCPKFR